MCVNPFSFSKKEKSHFVLIFAYISRRIYIYIKSPFFVSEQVVRCIMKNSRFPYATGENSFARRPYFVGRGFPALPRFTARQSIHIIKLIGKFRSAERLFRGMGRCPQPRFRRRAEAAKGRSAQFTATAFRVIRVATSRGYAASPW